MNRQRIHLSLIRHGKTRNNLEGRFCGRSDYPLVPEGEDFIRELVARYPYPEPQAIFVSPAVRCVRTAQLSFPGREFEIVEDLQELSFGEYEERFAREIWDVPALAQGWGQQLPEFAFPGGETIGACRDRGIRVLRWILTRAAEEGWDQVAVVSHSVLISATLKSLLRVLPEDRYALFCPNGMGIGVAVPEGEALAERPLEYLGHLPAGAPIPDMRNNPYSKKTP